jgi:hypothetical protein
VDDDLEDNPLLISARFAVANTFFGIPLDLRFVPIALPFSSWMSLASYVRSVERWGIVSIIRFA